jgi:oxygen-independent coproporphyrinogen-3 oxidase
LNRPTVGVYVHFPWCLQKCPYCDFTSYAALREEVPHDRYAEAVVRELAHRARDPGIAGAQVATVFIGGGTPSLWRPAALARVLAAIRAELDVAADLEVTAECNPSSLDDEVAAALVGAGVGRLSVGVQALDGEQLAYLGRLHDASGALRALRAARRAVPRVSADLIYGMPGHTVAELERTLDAVLETGVEHVSAYALTVEPNTPFGERARRGQLPIADDDRFADLFEAARERLGARGFDHYEISNHARPGAASRHNLGYWRGAPYLGLGVGAFGTVPRPGGALRWRNALDPRRYLDDPVPARAPWSEDLGPRELVNEGVLLGLRLAEGVDLAGLGDRWGVDAIGPRAGAIAALEENGLLVRDGPRLRIPPDRWLLADGVIRRLLV